jgi:putative Mg2+ transporter-C (MgtC) family protein
MFQIDRIVIDLILATIFGGIIGLERQRAKQFAGLRTHMIVCMGATLITFLSVNGFSSDISGPARIVANIIVAAGFIGAGTIIAAGRQVHGLTTAASIWIVAAIGMAIALHFYIAAVSTVILTLLVLELWRLEVEFGLKKKGE